MHESTFSRGLRNMSHSFDVFTTLACLGSISLFHHKVITETTTPPARPAPGSPQQRRARAAWQYPILLVFLLSTHLNIIFSRQTLDNGQAPFWESPGDRVAMVGSLACLDSAAGTGVNVPSTHHPPLRSNHSTHTLSHTARTSPGAPRPHRTRATAFYGVAL